MAIIITEKAATEIQRVRDEQKLETEQFLRIGVTGGGCSGFSYTMGFDKAYKPENDLGRMAMTIEKLETPVEMFTIVIEPGTGKSGRIVMTWDTVKMIVPFSVM